VYCLEIAIVKQKLYTELWTYWRKIFDNNDDILEAMYEIESIFVAKTLQGMCEKTISHPLGQFMLRNRYQSKISPEPEEQRLQQEPFLVWYSGGRVMIQDYQNHAHSGHYMRDPSKWDGDESDSWPSRLWKGLDDNQ
jgi:hypothetical protein